VLAATHQPKQAGKGSSVGAVALPVTACAIYYGAPSTGPEWMPTELLASVPSSLVGKVEFYSAEAAAAGLGPLPDYIPPLEDTRSELAKRFPLAMISPPARHFLNSSFVNVTSLRAAEGEPCLDIHPDDARARGVADESYVRVFNDRGSLTLRARVTDRARRGVVVALSVWWKKLARDGKNANELTRSDALTDMGKAPLFYDCLVQVEPAYAAQTLEAAT